MFFLYNFCPTIIIVIQQANNCTIIINVNIIYRLSDRIEYYNVEDNVEDKDFNVFYLYIKELKKS